MVTWPEVLGYTVLWEIMLLLRQSLHLPEARCVFLAGFSPFNYEPGLRIFLAFSPGGNLMFLQFPLFLASLGWRADQTTSESNRNTVAPRFLHVPVRLCYDLALMWQGKGSVWSWKCLRRDLRNLEMIAMWNNYWEESQTVRGVRSRARPCGLQPERL